MTQADRIEQKLDKLLQLLTVQQKPEPPAPVGSFAYRLQQAKKELAGKV